MLRKCLLLYCLVILPFPFMNLTAQENGEKRTGFPKINLEVAANRIDEQGKTILTVSYTIKNLTEEKLFLFNVSKPYIFPKENKIVEIGQYDPPSEGSTGPYIFHKEVSVTIIKPQKTLEKTLKFSYPIEVFYPEIMRLRMVINKEITSSDEKQTVTPEKIQVCLGVASPSQTKPQKKGKKSKGFYLASAFEIGRREIVCSNVIQLK